MYELIFTDGYDITREAYSSYDEAYSALFESIWEIPSWSIWEDKKYYAPYEEYNWNWCEHLLWWADKGE